MSAVPHDERVLRCGGAVAVLLCELPAERPARDEAATAALRALTGLDTLSISRRPSGRPRLNPPHCELGVSMAVRDGVVLVGCDPRRSVGVDLEFAGTCTAADAVRLARDHFGAEEADRIAHTDGAHAGDLFLAHWVAKEAALKLTGRGVFDGLAWPPLHLERAPEIGRPGNLEVAAVTGKPALTILLAALPERNGRTALAALCTQAP